MAFEFTGTKALLADIISQKRRQQQMEQSPQWQLAQMELQQRAKDAAFLEQLSNADVSDLPTLMKYHLRIDPKDAIRQQMQSLAMKAGDWNTAAALGLDLRGTPQGVEQLTTAVEDAKEPYNISESNRRIKEIQEEARLRDINAGIPRTTISRTPDKTMKDMNVLDAIRVGVTPESWQKFEEGGKKDASILKVVEDSGKYNRPTRDQIIRSEESAIKEIDNNIDAIKKLGAYHTGNIFSITDEDKQVMFKNLLALPPDEIMASEDLSDTMKELIMQNKRYRLMDDSFTTPDGKRWRIDDNGNYVGVK